MKFSIHQYTTKIIWRGSNIEASILNSVYLIAEILPEIVPSSIMDIDTIDDFFHISSFCPLSDSIIVAYRV
jgi:hypothetical protein